MAGRTCAESPTAANRLSENLASLQSAYPNAAHHMIKANDFVGRTEEIYDLVSDDHVEQALKRILDFVKDFSSDREYQNEVVIAIGEYKGIKGTLRRGEIDWKEAGSERRKLLLRVLGLITAIEEDPSPDVAA